MPPSGGGKRKRGDRSYSGDNFSRPSPYRPESLSLAQQSQAQSPSNAREQTDLRGRGGRRSNRGGRGPSLRSNSQEILETVSSPAQSSIPDQPNRIAANGTMSTDIDTATEAGIQNPMPQPYAYSYISDDICENWACGGYQATLEQAILSLRNSDVMETRILVEELIHSVLTGRIPPSSAGEFVKQLVDTANVDSVPNIADLHETILGSISIAYDGVASVPLERLAAFLLTSEISPDLFRQELDAPLLEKLDLIRSTFSRMGIRKQTNVLYRQANFNLMREESEGFAKLITELFSTSGSEPPTSEVVEETVEKVKAMIGAFDLDVGRSLDVVLDVFGAVLVKQHRFFVKFLRASPWWPRLDKSSRQSIEPTGLPLWALPGEPGLQLSNDQKDLIVAEAQERDAKFWAQAKQQGLQAFYSLGLSRVPEKSEQAIPETLDDEFSAAWMRETGNLPPRGNRDAAQLLGFKLRFYSSSPARDETDVLPDNLIYLSALLIKIGFISLKDLYPHIWRSDEAMNELRQQKSKEKTERERASRPGAGARNALLTAGALADDTIPVPPRLRESATRAGTPSKESEPEKPKESTTEPADQKVLLLKSLLAIGALPEGLYVLGKFPWLLDLYPDLPEYVNRIIHHALSCIYESFRPLEGRQSLISPKPCYETDIPGVPKGQVKVLDAPERKILRWALLDRSDSSDGTDYRFYWDEWNDNIPLCRTVDDVFVLCGTLLPLVGVKIGQDPTLVLKLARIGKHSLIQDKSESNKARWLDLSKRILLPSLSMTKSNAGVVNEVFELISNFSISTRYLMYLEWSAGKTSRTPDIKSAFDQAKAETKDILKRISKTNVRPMARALAKVAYANPHIVITTALAQIEVYDSIAEVFVEGARYFTDLGYDVLTWAMISSMARAGRSRTQDGGIFTSRWLSALAQFAGKIYRRYSMMRPGPVLQYVAEQLDQGNSTDLKMLEQIVVSMAGIAIDTSYNDAQLQAMGGGALLQSQTILQLLDRRNDANTKVTSRRLTKSLQDNGLAGKLLILMAQQRQACVFEEGDMPLKVIGNTYDEIHRIMVQYLDLLRANLMIEDFKNTVPDILDLLIDYEIRPEIAFSISRPLIAKQIADFDRETLAARKSEEFGDAKDLNGDVEMSDHIIAGSEEDGEAIETEDVARSVATPTDAEINGANLDLQANDKTFASPGPAPDDQWHPILKPIMEGVEPTLSEGIVSSIGTGFYITFWQLSLYDITIPGKSYEDELSRQHKKIAAISADRSDVSLSGTRKKEAEKKVIGELIDSLLAENKQHLKAFAESKARLQHEKDLWFIGKARMIDQLNTALMEHCFFPRLLTSSLDAYFCFKFIKFLHGAGTSNFRTLGFYDLLFRTSRVTSLIFSCTSKEADNFGKFLNEILKDLARWHGTKATFEREAWGIKKSLPGFAMKIENGKPVLLLDFEGFRRVLYRWHNLLFAALQKCLLSPEYMHVRNAISILRAISGSYPAINSHGTGLQKVVDKLRDSDKEDLKVASQALLGALHRREKTWVIPQAFRQGQDNLGEDAANSTPAKVEAKAGEGKPVGIPLGKADEDGEVKDSVKAKFTKESTPTEESATRDLKQLSSTVKPETVHEGRRIPSRPPPTSDPGTSRSVNDIPVSDRRDTRTPRSDPTKSHGLPRRVSPPRHQVPTSLPSRPEAGDVRNGLRDSPRMPPRPLPDLGRPTSDIRIPYSRENRPPHRGHEVSYDDYERHARRHERSGGPPYGPRDEREYGREREVERPHNTERLRPSERERNSERERTSVRPPPREPPKERDPRERPLRGVSAPQQPEDPQPKPLAAPARPGSSHSDTVSINPERAALINNPVDQRSNVSIRGQAQERPARFSRPTSPKREEDRRPPHRDDRAPPDRRSDIPASRPGASLVSSPGPNQRSGPGGQHQRESRASYNHSQIDMQQGRLEQDPSHRPPQRSERPAEPEVPSGPRSRPPMQAGRGRGTPAINTQASQTPNAERPTPTGPSSRNSRNNSYHESTPANQGSVDGGGVHPSRMNQIEPSPTDTTNPSHSQTSPPAGPRGNAPVNAPSGPSPTTRAPPAGPHMGDTSGRGGRSNRHPLAAVNNTLSQAGQGTSIRGRGGIRQNSSSFTPHMPPPGSHGSRSDGFPPQQDLFGAQNPNGMPIAARSSASRPENGRDRRRDGEDRDGERRSSRRHEEPRERDGRDGKDNKDEGEPSRREERPPRRDDQQHGEDHRGYRSGPRDEMPSRKHGRGDDGGPYSGGGGRGVARTTSESKRPRRVT